MTIASREEVPNRCKIRRKSTSTIKPPSQYPLPPRRVELTSWDLQMLSVNYIEKGHLFSLPSLDEASMHHILTSLQSSLSLTLIHFYPLAGRLATATTDDGSLLYIDCSNQGAELSHFIAECATVSDVFGPSDGDLHSDMLRLLFPHEGAINHDGHAIPLLSVQVTQLVDGFFLGCSFNHVVGDGTSFWHFFNTWAEICRGGCISRLPVHDRWFPSGTSIPVRLPFRHPNDFIQRFPAPVLRERMFHFSGRTMAALKAKANRSGGGESNSELSSFQALSALIWRATTRARRLPDHQETSCNLAIENRSRLRPSLSPNCFGNSICTLKTTTTVGKLLKHDLGWAARLLKESIAAHDDEKIRGMLRTWLENPVVYKLSMFDVSNVMMGSSPRFDMYGCEFGWGKAVALRSGGANKVDGKMSSYPGREGGGSVDVEVCLMPETMSALESDDEFMDIVSRVK